MQPKAHAIFEHALALQGEARAAYLAEACGSDAALRAEVDRLFAAHAKAGDFLAKPTTEPPTADTPLVEGEGTLIGRYKLLQSIGEGGFGWVFMAMQSEPVKRKVALKIIKPGMDTKQVSARFEAERQALAIMDHPHIARVLDGGVTNSGRPYFVMEYVVGDPIVAFANAHKLSIKDRLTLFTQVCQAVQHAHLKGIIHRDLKPANVLVFMSDGKPFAKVIDFGIAKATGAAGGTLTDKTLFTEHRQLLGTPEYMSPEQAEGSPDIDTRTDVYALGVLLYELLTGQTPFDGKRLRSAAFAEMQRIIKEEEPPTPSLRLERSLSAQASPSAASAPSSLSASGANTIGAHDLKGELDWIVMKALDKDRARRYESASQLAADVERHLSGEAVVAAPPTLGYRARKYVRRHKRVVVSVSTVILALASGGSVAAWQWHRAQQQTNRAQAENNKNRELMQFLEEDRANVAESVSLFTRNILAQTGRIMIMSEDRPTMELSTDDPKDPGRMLRVKIIRGATPEASRVVGLNDQRQEVPLTIAQSVFAINTITSTTLADLRYQTDAAEWSAYTANIALAQSAIDSDTFPEARRILDGTPIGKRGWEFHFLDRQSHACVLALNGVRASQLSSDGTRIVVVGARGTPHDGQQWYLGNESIARVLDVATGESIAELRGHSADIYSAAFSKDGTQIVTASEDGTARVWNAITGTCTAVLRGHKANLWNAVFSPNGKLVVTTSHDKTARLWDASTGLELVPPLAHQDYVDGVRFSQDGGQFLIDQSNGDACIWNAATGTLVNVLKGVTLEGRRSNMSLDFRWIFAPAVNGADLVDALTGETTASLRGLEFPVSMASGSPNAHRVLLTSYREAAIWLVDSGRRVSIPLIPRPSGTDMSISPFTMQSFSDDGCILVTHYGDTLSRVWDTSTGTCLGLLPQAAKATFSHDARLVVLDTYRDFVSMGGRVPSSCQIVDMCEAVGPSCINYEGDQNLSLQLARILGSDGEASVSGLTITTPDNSRIIKGSVNRTVRFLDAQSPEREVAVFRVPEAVTNLQMTSDGTRLIIFFRSGAAQVWDIRDPSARRADMQREWAERVPADAYLDGLWAGPTPTAELREAIVNDPTLTPLRRLVAVEMCDGRQEDDRVAAERAFAAITTDQTDPVVVQARSESVDLPPRIKMRVLELAKAWTYIQPK